MPIALTNQREEFITLATFPYANRLLLHTHTPHCFAKKMKIATIKWAASQILGFGPLVALSVLLIRGNTSCYQCL